MLKNRQFYHRLGFAISGIFEAWKRERSFRTQVFLGLAAAVFTVAIAPGWIWDAAVALSIVSVLALELLNTALEGLIDKLHPSAAPEIKLAKDVAAGAVLIASFGAGIVGLLMIVSRFWR